VTKLPTSTQYVGVSEQDRPPGSGLDAFDAIYDRELDYVWRSLARLGVPAGDLPDAVHEVFIVLHRKWDEIDRERTLRPWLFGVARRVAADARAKRRELPASIEPPAGADPLAAQRELLYRAMDVLDDDRRIVLVLHDLEGHTGAEIAAMLDLPVNTVHSRLRLARAEVLAAVRALEGKR